ncbi:MAG: hypothetical protein FWD36_06085 [Treponema sp.]|nr:hypothetical protein [Treponema sp.]
MDDNELGRDVSRLAWHPAFVQAIELELRDYRDSLEFKHEYQLTAEPLRVDLLVIKKPKELVIDKNIARIFRTDNLLEYKSPEDSVSIKTFLKSYACANLYTAITPKVELSDVTLTLVESKHPRKLLQYLSKVRHYQIEETAPGIYLVSGDYIPIQIINSKKLSANENLWLRSLRKDLEISNASAILEARKQRNPPLDAYFDVVLRANLKTFLEVFNMREATLEEVFVDAYMMEPARFENLFTKAGVIPKWVGVGRAEGIEQGVAQEKAEVVRNLFAMDMSIENIAKAVQLPIEKVYALAAEG